jgi:transposase-like protein
VVIGAMSDGTKEVLAVTAGYRESKEWWHELFADLKARELEAPKLLVADGIPTRPIRIRCGWCGEGTRAAVLPT